MCIFFTFIHFTNRKHSRCGERDKIYMTNFQHGWGKKLKTSLVINYFFIDSLTTNGVHSCSAGWIGLITHTMGSSMPKSKILLQISGDVPTEKIYFTTAGAKKKNLKAHFKVCLGNFKVVTLVFSSVSLGLLRHDMSMKHTIYGHTHIVFFSTLDY